MGIQSVVGTYDTLELAEGAIQLLDRGGFPITQISIVARSLLDERRVSGYVTTGDIAGQSAAIGGWTGGLFGLLVGAAFIWVPGIGPLVVAGPLAAALLGGIEGAALGAAGGGLLGALAGWGVSSQHILKYENSLRAGKYLLVAHGSRAEVARAWQLLNTTSTGDLDSHVPTPRDETSETQTESETTPPEAN